MELINKQARKAAKERRLGNWHLFYAILPVECIDGRRFCFEEVGRRAIYSQVDCSGKNVEGHTYLAITDWEYKPKFDAFLVPK